jgi:outer membrane autotransporter protein
MNKAYGIGVGGVVLVTTAFTPAAMAACSNTAPPSNTTVSCSGAGLPAVAAQAGSTGVTINFDATASGSFVHATNAVAFSVDTSSTITNSGSLSLTGGGGTGTARGAVLLGVNNNNQITNAAAGVITTTGAFNDGMAANGSGNTLTNHGSITTSGPNAYGMTAAWGQTNVGQLNNTLTNTGSVSTSGSNARATSILGGSGLINNSGTLSTTGASSTTVYMQGNSDQLINSGTITASGSGSDAVFSNTVGSSFTATIENLAGGQIISQNAAGIRTLNGNSTVINAGLVQSNAGTAISMGNGNNSLILQTGSAINGDAVGGTGSNTVTLQGTGTASNAFTNFQTLLMQGTLWNWTGSGTFTLAHVQTGTLNLTGTLGATTSAVVDTGATLQANAQNLPQNVTDNGLVRFAQDSAGTYGGLIAGAGVVEKTGAGTLTLAPATAGGNTYAGGTNLDQGVLAVGADNALGVSAGGITFNGGVLQLTQSLDLASTRAITLNAGGGTFDTQSFASTLAQPVTGVGALTKAGTGSLLMTGVSSYSGGTTVAAGTLAVGDASTQGAALGGGGTVTVASEAALGGYGSVTGDVTSNGTISVANALAEFANGPAGNFTINGNVTNAGLAQLAGSDVGNTLTVVGNYSGRNATAALNTQLGADNSPSDKIVISGGQASGTTTLNIRNMGGTGGLTLANGIQVVQAVNGGTTAAGAFAQGNTLSAGAYTYALYQGGVTDGTQNNWYLRSSLPPTPTPTPGPTSTPPSSIGEPEPILAEGAPNLPTTSPGTTSPVPIYRMEVPVYAEVTSLAREMLYQQIGTFHDRQGSQSLLGENGVLPAGWARVWGDHTVQGNGGAVNQQFDGTIGGAQIGQDVYSDTTASGHHNHYGFFLGYARATGDVDGFALAQPDFAAGHLSISSYSLGGYWTHIGPGGWYTDTVLVGSSMTIDPQSNENIGADTHGNAFTASVEAGLPIPMPLQLSIEPQAQLIYQDMHISDLNDGVSTVAFHSQSGLIGRLGARLFGEFSAAGMAWQPYVRVNVLRYFGGTDEVTFAGTTALPTNIGQTEAQVGTGISARINNTVSVYATAGYLFNLGGAHERTFGGDAGVRLSW